MPIPIQRTFAFLAACLLIFSLNGPLHAAAADAEAPRMAVSASVSLGEQVLGQPQRTLAAGDEFNFTLGERGKLQVHITGRTAPINDRASALDYTVELEEWTAAGSAVKRASQTVRVENGTPFILGGINDTQGRPLTIRITVRRP